MLGPMDHVDGQSAAAKGEEAPTPAALVGRIERVLLEDERATLRGLRIMGEGGRGGALLLELRKIESLSPDVAVDKSPPSNAERLSTLTNREATAGKLPAVSYPSAEIVGDGPGSASMSPLRTTAEADDEFFETFQGMEGVRGEVLRQCGICFEDLAGLSTSTNREATAGKRPAVSYPSAEIVGDGPGSASMSPLRTTAAADDEFFDTFQDTEGVRGEVLTQCGICFEDLAGSDKILPCAHDFCIACLQDFAALLVKEGSVEGLTCPDVGCRKDMSVEVLRFLLSEDDFDRWEWISTSRTLDALEDVAYCPRCGALCEGGEDYKMSCYKCSHNFCLHCRDKWHGIFPCDEAGPSETPPKVPIPPTRGLHCAPVKAKIGYPENGETSRQKMHRLENIRLLLSNQLKRPAAGMKKSASYERRENERLDLEYVKQQAKQCPRCRIGIQKVDGCNRIQCRNCGTHFCYVCTAQVTGYSHFNNRCGLHEPTPRMPAAFLNDHLPPRPWPPPPHRRRAFWEGCRRALCCCFG